MVLYLKFHLYALIQCAPSLKADFISMNLPLLMSLASIGASFSSGIYVLRNYSCFHSCNIVSASLYSIFGANALCTTFYCGCRQFE